MKFELTYDSPKYEPSDDWYATMEDQGFNQSSSENRGLDTHMTCEFSFPKPSLLTAPVVANAEQESQSNSLLLDISPMLCEHSLANELKALVNISSTQASGQSLAGKQVTEQWLRWHRFCHYSLKLWCWFRCCQTNLEGYDTMRS
jgi:hypothetical protein